jgi:hypothetical protein
MDLPGLFSARQVCTVHPASTTQHCTVRESANAFWEVLFSPTMRERPKEGPGSTHRGLVMEDLVSLLQAKTRKLFFCDIHFDGGKKIFHLPDAFLSLVVGANEAQNPKAGVCVYATELN